MCTLIHKTSHAVKYQAFIEPRDFVYNVVLSADPFLTHF